MRRERIEPTDNKIVVIDNFLSDSQHQYILQTMSSSEFGWSFVDCISSKQDPKDLYFFIRLMYGYNADGNHSVYFCSSYQSIIPILCKLNPRGISRVKANCYPSGSSIIEHPLHVDTEFNSKVALYCVNSNNGYTYFENGQKIESVANRMILFDGSVKHAGTNCTDQKVRLNINFNYF